MTREGRLGLNGPQVIEQEAGVAELDSEDRRLVWETIGGEQRVATGMADALVEDDVAAIAGRSGPRSAPEHPWSTAHRSGTTKPGSPGSTCPNRSTARRCAPGGREMSRGKTWFEALAGAPGGEPASVLCADGAVDGERARFLAVVPNPERGSPARGGELGLEEGWALARYVRAGHADGDRRALVAVVDVPGQPYGYREELLGLHLALAAAVDAYATARLAGHPVVALVVGQAISGAFLAHGMQANRILALEDPGVAVQVMSKRSTARVTRRTWRSWTRSPRKCPPPPTMSPPSPGSGAPPPHRGVDAAEPDAEDVETVRDALAEAISSARHDGSADLSGRFASPRPANTGARACESGSGSPRSGTQ